MRLTFRFKLFVASLSVVSMLMAAVLWAGWAALLRQEQDRLDARLCQEARRVSHAERRDESAQRLAADMAAKLHLPSADQLMFLQRFPDGKTGMQFGQWPAELQVTDIVPEHAGRDPVQRDGAGQPDSCRLKTRQWQQVSWRVAVLTASEGEGLVAADLADTGAELREAVQQQLPPVLALALLLTGVAAWLLAGLALRPVNRLRESMRSLTPRDLGQRLSDAGADAEFAELIATYNHMLERLEISFHQASRFSGDAAHELRTPLTILRGQLEQILSQTSDTSRQSELAEILDQVGKLNGITRRLLLLSRADAGQLPLHPEWLNLSDLLDDLISDARMLVANQQLEASIPRQLQLQADNVLLQQLLNNLISNAVRYCCPGGWIRIHAQQRDTEMVVMFSNQCLPVPAAERARFFERFYRAANAAGHADGSGLGLSLALEIARAHHGSLRLLDTPDNEVSLELRLPLTQAPDIRLPDDKDVI